MLGVALLDKHRQGNGDFLDAADVRMPEEKGEHLRLLLKILGELARLLLAGFHIPLIEGFLHLIERLQQIIGVAGHNYNGTDAQRGGQQQHSQGDEHTFDHGGQSSFLLASLYANSLRTR